MSINNMEQKIKYITSNDFLKISDWVLMRNYPIKELSYNYLIPEKVKKNDIIFIKTDFLYEFMNIIDKIRCEVTIITGNSDIIIDEKYIHLINNSKIKKWYAINSILKHKKLINIPLGLQNEHLYINNNPQSNQKLLSESSLLNISETNDILMSFNISTNKNHRQNIFNSLINKPNIKHRSYKNNDRLNERFMLEYYREIKSNKFVICPLGNGPDCHRYWEVLYLGSIPIIQKHPALDSFFENDKLPVLYVDSIKDILKYDLDDKYDKIQNIKYNLDILNFVYWKKQLKK